MLNRFKRHLFACSQDCEEQQRLLSDKPLRHSSTLLALSPFLGDGGLFLVGCRLSNSSMSVSQKYPPILSAPNLPPFLFCSFVPLPLWPFHPPVNYSFLGTCTWSQTTRPVHMPQLCGIAARNGWDSCRLPESLQALCLPSEALTMLAPSPGPTRAWASDPVAHK